MNYAADLDLFFEDAEDFTVGMETVSVVFNDPSKNLSVFDQEVNSTAPFGIMKDADVTAQMIENGTIITREKDGVGYEVINVAPDGAGLSIVTLTKA